MAFITIHDLVSDTKKQINDINSIVDVLLSEYRTASEMLDSYERRDIIVNQFKELNATLKEIVDTHPAIRIDQIWQNASRVIAAIASTNVKEGTT